jgi:branched-chain amino acid transport system permease protein
MDYFLQQLVNGLQVGSLYALVALGITLVYGILQMLNFAHGDVYMVGAFIAAGVAGLFVRGQVPLAPAVVVVLLMLVAAMLGAGFLGGVIERVAYRPLRARGGLALVVTSIGVALLIRYTVAIQVTAGPVTVQSNALVPPTLVHIGPVETPLMAVVVFMVALVLMVALDVFVFRTAFGAAIRATAQDREAAGFMGIDVDRMIITTFILGSALAGIGGVLFGLRYGTVDYFMGNLVGLKAFAAAVLGGIGNLRGAMVGGLALGVMESLAGGFLSTAFQDMFAFLLLILVLIIRPWGMFGERPLERA